MGLGLEGWESRLLQSFWWAGVQAATGGTLEGPQAHRALAADRYLGWRKGLCFDDSLSPFPAPV